MRKTMTTLVAVGMVWALGGCPPPRCEGPDPKAMSISYTKVSDSGSGSGEVTITGRVTNRGMTDFTSSEGQQAVYLYEGSQLIAQTAFVNLAVDASVTVTYTRSWSLSDEFRPPSYTVELAYDPDIFIDGNPGNDDCNLNNNSLERDTSAIDALFAS